MIDILKDCRQIFPVAFYSNGKGVEVLPKLSNWNITVTNGSDYSKRMTNTPDYNLEKLKEGFLFWNKYRTDIDEKQGNIDLSHLQIEGRHWRFNELKNAELHQCNFTNTEFRDIDFIDIDFSGSDFTNARFINVRFTKCHFSGNSLENVYFNDTSWFHSSWCNTVFPVLKSFDTIRFYKCSFTKDLFDRMGVPDAIFEDCHFNLSEKTV